MSIGKKVLIAGVAVVALFIVYLILQRAVTVDEGMVLHRIF